MPEPAVALQVCVPAWQTLFSAHDTALKHFRRYSAGAFHELLVEEGLKPVRQGGVFHSLLLPRALAVLGEALLRRLGREPAPPATLGSWRRGALISTALERALALDNALTHALVARGYEIPGLSVWALCRVRDEVPAT